VSADAPPATRVRRSGRKRLVEAGDLVSNRPLRERCEWLMANSDSFSLSAVCFRIEELGIPGYVKDASRWSGARRTGDTTRLQRALGMKPHPAGKKSGREYEPTVREFVPYELAVALADALGLDPVDAGV
jgi:hypothetical protein